MRLGAAKLIITIAGLSHSTAMAQSFLGLSLAPRLITVAEVWQNRSAGPIVQLEGSEAYQAAFAGIARQESQERNALIKALTGSLKTVQAATNTHLNRRVQISALSLPSTVHAVATKKIMRDAMIDIGFAPSEDLQSMEMPFAAHYAYDLGTAKGLGLEKGACDWDMGVYEAVLVDYNKDILSVLLLDLAEHGCVVRGEMNALELGEGAVSDGSSDSKQNAAQKPLVPEARIQSHYAAIQQKLEAFLSQETLLKESASNTGANWKPLRSDIRAVILAGDASLEGFDHLRSLLRETFADIPANGWLKDTIDPKDMAAIGAAKRIQHMANKPEDFHVHVQHVGHSHDEL